MRTVKLHFILASLLIAFWSVLSVQAQVLPNACSAQQLNTALCASVAAGLPSDAWSPKPAASNPPPSTAFNIKSYQGSSWCLDYSPGKGGSPIFLNNCAKAHPVTVEDIGDGNHTVILHAGKKVIGIPPGAAVTLGSSADTADLPLVLLTPASKPYGNVLFSLDGDSIILVSNRDTVVKVENARGVAGTPIVIGTRNLADNEFWDFVATDGSDTDPTSGFVRVGYPGDPYCANPQFCICRLYDRVANASSGTVVKLGTSLDLTDCPTLYVGHNYFANNPSDKNGGITIRGDRRDAHFYGPALTRRYDGGTGSEPDMFDIEGDDVRLTNLNVQGPSRSTDSDQRNATGVRVNPHFNPDAFNIGELRRSIVDHSQFSGFTYAAVKANEQHNDTQCLTDESSDPVSRPTNFRVARNLIVYNRMEELGYGVEVEQGGYALIDGNTFYSNRHAIAGDGRAKSGYKAFNNLVLSAAPLQHDIFHTQDFDMHGTGSGGFGGIGGDYVGVFQNTFLGTNRPNMEIRGNTCNYVDYAGNISLEDEGDAISLSLGFLGGSPIVDLRVAADPPQFDHHNPTLNSNALRVGDFDGDGYDDLFLATGAGWYYSPAGKGDWRFLSAKEETVGQLLFGDFDGDGRTDVVTIDALGRLVVSWGGISDWDVLNVDLSATGLPFSQSMVSEMTTGDFDGDGVPDIFWADGATWWVSYGGITPFEEVQTSVFRIPRLRFGDFNGDGRTDVFSVGPENWQVSYAPSAGRGLFTEWQKLRPKLTDTVDNLFVADLNGDGFADVFTDCASAGCWRISYYGFEDWESFSQPVPLYLDFAGAGRFIGQRAADVLTWNEFGLCDSSHGQNTQLCISVAGFEPATHYSLQDMR